MVEDNELQLAKIRVESKNKTLTTICKLIVQIAIVIFLGVISWKYDGEIMYAAIAFIGVMCGVNIESFFKRGVK